MAWSPDDSRGHAAPPPGYKGRGSPEEIETAAQARDARAGGRGPGVDDRAPQEAAGAGAGGFLRRTIIDPGPAASGAGVPRLGCRFDLLGAAPAFVAWRRGGMAAAVVRGPGHGALPTNRFKSPPRCGRKGFVCTISIIKKRGAGKWYTAW